MKVIDYGNILEAVKALPLSASKSDVLTLLRMMPVLDQEDLPIVKELRAQIEQLNIEIADRERYSIEQHAEIHEYRDEIRDLEAELACAIQERDEAEAALDSWFVPDGTEE